MAIFKKQETAKSLKMAAEKAGTAKPQVHSSYNPVAQERSGRRPRRPRH